MSLNATSFSMPIASKFDELMGQVKDGVLSLPAQRQVGGGDNLDEVHEVVSLFVGLVLGIVQWIHVVVSPSHALLANLSNNIVRQLRAEAKMVDLMREGVFNIVAPSPVVFQVVNMHVAVAEGFARGEVEVANNLVDTDTSFDTAAFSTLLIEMLRVMLACTLFDILSSSEGPRDACISVADFSTSVAAARLLCVRGGWCTITFSAVIGVQVGSGVIAVTGGR